MRPPVSVVTPFRGDPATAERLSAALDCLDSHDGDEVVIADNTLAGTARHLARDRVRVVHATRERSSYHARNEGARVAASDWILFLDADCIVPADLLDRFLPAYEVGECHAIEVAAPAAVTYEAARAMDINRAPLVRAIFATRTLPSRLRGQVERREPQSLVDETQALGWRILSEVPGRVLVMGAYTQPWQAEVIFHGLPPAEFVAFHEPGYAKIVWTLEAEPLGPARSRFVTRTRVATTDFVGRARFRHYWSVFSPGILLIRRAALALVKREAERHYSSRSQQR
jgi:glycosyltransferase involved in cell wall biosynthesis